MSKIEIPPITSENGLLNEINIRFSEIASHLNNNVLYRDISVIPEEPNYMNNPLDMAEHPIINLREPEEPTEPVRLIDLQEAVMPGAYDHGLLTGLEDDDHPQYLNEERGDLRYLIKQLMAEGSIPYVGSTGELEDSSTLYRNPSNGFVGVGHNNPTAPIHTLRTTNGLGATVEKAGTVIVNDYVSLGFDVGATSGVSTEIRTVKKASDDTNSIEFYQRIGGSNDKTFELKSDGNVAVTNDLLVGDDIFAAGAAFGNVGTEGTTISVGGVAFNTEVKISDIGATEPAMLHLHRHSTSFSPLIVGSRSNSNTAGHTSVVQGQGCFEALGTGWTGATYGIMGGLSIQAGAGSFSGSSSPGQMVLSTTPNGGILPVERLRITSSGQISTGNENAPDVDPGAICINHGANDGLALSLKNSDVDHGVTDVVETDTYGTMSKFNADDGGLLIQGLSESTTGVQEYGIVTTATTTFTTPAAVSLRGALKSGTGVTSLGTTANVISFINNTTMLGALKGNGNLELLGGIKLSNTGTVLGRYEEGTWTPTIAGSITAGAHTYASQSGQYVRIGKIVVAACFLHVNVKDATMDGSIRIAGLPFTISNDVDHYPSCSLGLTDHISKGTADVVMGYGVQNTTIINLVKNTLSTTGLSTSVIAADIGNNPKVGLVLVYKST